MCCAESKSRLYVSYKSYKKSLQLPIDPAYEIAYTRVGISPGFLLRKWEENTFCSLVRFNLCANVLWVSCEWETKHGEGKKEKKIQPNPPPAHKRNMNFDFYQSISHFWCFSAAHIWLNNSANGNEEAN